MKAWWVGLASIAGLAMAPSAHAAGPTVKECVETFEKAQRAQKDGHLIQAGEDYAECSVSSCPKPLQQDCLNGQADADRATPTISVVVRYRDGTKAPTAILTLDDLPFIAEAGHATRIDPGNHKFTFTLGGQSPKSNNILIHEGEKNRVIVLDAEAPPPSTVAVAAPAPHGPAILGPVILGVVGILLVGTSVPIFALSGSEANDRDRLKATAVDQSQPVNVRQAAATSADSHNDAANSDQTRAIVIGATGIVALAGAATWFLLSRPSADKRTAVLPMLAPGTAGLGVSRSF